MGEKISYTLMLSLTRKTFYISAVVSFQIEVIVSTFTMSRWFCVFGMNA